MNYNTMMRDCARYIENHWQEKLTGETLGQVYSYAGEYFSYLFSAYYEQPLNLYLQKIREKKAGSYQEEGTALVTPRRILRETEVEIRYQQMDSFILAGTPLIKKEEDMYDPVRSVAEKYRSLMQEEKLKQNESYLSIWWHNDNNYTIEQYEAYFCADMEDVPEDKIPMYIPGSEYAIFSLKKDENLPLEETLKLLTNYVLGTWEAENEEKINRLGYAFHCFENNRAYFFLPILEEDKRVSRDTVYSIEVWTKYIDDHINMNLTTTALAQQFHYSETHFKRIFRYYYKMTVSDYIRKRRLQAAALQIRNGVKCAEAARRFSFKTYAGFARAFQKEFNMTPTEYSNNDFEVVNLAEYYKEYKDRFLITYLEIKDIKMIGHSVIESEGDDADLPAQVCYWLDKDFPCLENTRFSCNKERREEKIALWYRIPEKETIDYILGPVVDEFEDDIPEEMVCVTLEGGRYAMFETERTSDKDDLPETLRMFTRCAFYGWIKEHEDLVDLSRITFERYMDNKIYLYVPVK